jgi:hypothetical protein
MTAHKTKAGKDEAGPKRSGKGGGPSSSRANSDVGSVGGRKEEMFGAGGGRLRGAERGAEGGVKGMGRGGGKLGR